MIGVSMVMFIKISKPHSGLNHIDSLCVSISELKKIYRQDLECDRLPLFISDVTDTRDKYTCGKNEIFFFKEESGVNVWHNEHIQIL